MGSFVLLTSGTQSKSLQGALKGNITIELKYCEMKPLVKNRLQPVIIIKAKVSIKFIFRETLKYAFTIKDSQELCQAKQ